MSRNRVRPSGMLTFASVARRLNRAPQTVAKWIDCGEFPKPTTLNKRKYFFEHDVAAWFDRTHVTNAAPADDRDNAIHA